MEERNGWWAPLISVGMIAYGAAAERGILSQAWASQITRQGLVPLLILVVGVVSLIFALMRQPGDPSPVRYPILITPYVLAWRKLWRTKWMLWVYGVLGLVAIIDSGIWDAIYRSTAAPVSPPPSSRGPSFIQLVLHSALPYWSGHALSKFLPFSGPQTGSIVFGVAVLVVAVLLVPLLIRLRREPEYARKIAFFSVCVALFVLWRVFSTVVVVQEWRDFVATQRAERAAAAAPAHRGADLTYPHTFSLGGRRVQSRYSQSVVMQTANLAAEAVFGGIMVGGILGSLLRKDRGESVTALSFVSDSVKYFEPIAALLLICALPALLLYALAWVQIPWLVSYVIRPLTYVIGIPAMFVTPALMFAPFAVVRQGLGWREAIMQSLRIWAGNWWAALSLVATGCFFFALVNGPVELLYPTTDKTQVFFAFVQALSAIVSCVGSAVILLAVWEFYSALVPERETVPQ